ncbi:MAG: hypothetical protein JWM27_4402 [Gemmatimonadetes bacterium]|nr:hypothetical protein [Gemmatimonadota bacterium]
MRNQIGARTLYLWTLLLRAARGPSPVATGLPSRPTSLRHPSPAPPRMAAEPWPASVTPSAETFSALSDTRASGGVSADPSGAPCVDACQAHRELRTRLVAEYRRRLDLVAAALNPLHDGWSEGAMERANRLARALDAWDAYLRTAPAAVDSAASEPAPDLHALGADVLDLVSRAAAHLAWSGPSTAGTLPLSLPLPIGLSALA